MAGLAQVKDIAGDSTGVQPDCRPVDTPIILEDQRIAVGISSLEDLHVQRVIGVRG
jgi:hypothetical protein